MTSGYKLEISLYSISSKQLVIIYYMTNLFHCYFRFLEKCNLEVLLLQSLEMHANRQKPFVRKLLAALNRSWDRIEKSELARGMFLRDELLR